MDGLLRGVDPDVVQLAAVGPLVVDSQLELLYGVHPLQAVVPAVLQLVLPHVVVDDALVDVVKVGHIHDGAAALGEGAATYLEVELAEGGHPAVVTLGGPEGDLLDGPQAEGGGEEAGDGEEREEAFHDLELLGAYLS